MGLPMSLRTKADEQAYQLARAHHKTVPLEKAKSLFMFEHWKVINNDYPYTVAFDTHHMLVPRRLIAERSELNRDEIKEFEEILIKFVYPNYDLWFENSPSRRSMNHIYHLHLGIYRKERLI